MDQQPSPRRSSSLPQGVEIRPGKRGDRLRITFTWQGVRRRETLDVPATSANIKYAARLRAEIQNAIERGTFDYGKFFPSSASAKKETPSVRLTVSQLVEGHIDRARKSGALSPSTIATYARWAKSRISPDAGKLGSVMIDELTTATLRTWIAELASELAPKSVRSCVGVLSGALSEATTDEVLLTPNPLTPIKLKTMLPKRKASAERDRIDPFNRNEIALILAACPTPQERAMIQFAFSTGLRIGELIALKWGNVKWKALSVHVEDNAVSGESGTVEKETKTDGSMRDVPLIPSALAALEMMRPISKLRSAYVFTHPKNGGRWTGENQYRKRWKIILRKAGVRYRYPYQTRHTFASTLLMAGEPELLVARLLGHTTVEMVRRHYGRWIIQPEGMKLRSSYSELGAGLGQCSHPSAPLSKGSESEEP